MVNNIDRPDAPVVNNVVTSRDWSAVQGDARALFGIRFRDPTYTPEVPVYAPIHASQWRGHILQRRSAAGVQALQADLDFNNVSFSFVSGSSVEFLSLIHI